MAKFLFGYRRDKDSRETLTPEEMQRAHQKWQAWMAEGCQKGWFFDRELIDRRLAQCL